MPSLQELLAQKKTNTALTKPAPSLQDLLGASGKKVSTVTAKAAPVQTEPTFMQKAGSFIKNIPSAIVSTFGSPVSLLEKTGSTIGEYAAKKMPLNLNVSKETQAKARGVQAELAKPITLPYQDIPIIKGADPFKSGREAAGLATEAGIDSLTNLLTFGGGSLISGAGKAVAKEVGKDLVKKTVSTVIKEAAPVIAKRSLFDFGTGFIGGAASEAQNPEATTSDILKTGLKSGGLSAALPVGLGATTRVLGAIGKFTGKTVGKVLDTGIKKLDDIAGKRPNTIETLFSTELPKLERTKLQKVAAKGSNILQSIAETPNKVSDFVNKYSPVKRFQNLAKENGIDTPDLEEMVQRTPHAAAGIAYNKVDDYLKMRAQYGEDWGYVKKYAQLLDLQDRLARGNEITGGKTAMDVERAIQTNRQFLGEERWAKVVEGTKQFNAFQEQQLSEALSSERISKEAYDSMRAAHPNYTPHEVLDFLDTDLPPQGTGKSFSLSKSGFEKALGSKRELDDIDNAVVSRLYRNAVLNEENKTVKAIIDVGKQNSELLGLKALRTAEDVNKRRSLYSTIKETSKQIGEFVTGRKEIKSKETKMRRGVSEISDMPIDSKEIKKIKSKIKQTSDELDTFMEEAQSLSADFETAPSKIDAILEKVDRRDKEILLKTDELNRKVLEYNSVKAKDLKRKSEALNSLRQTRKILSDLIDEKVSDLQELRKEVKLYRDIKMKPVDYQKQGYEKVSYFNNGVKEEWLVRKDLGNALKNLDGQNASGFMRFLDETILGRILQVPAKLTKALATSMNPTFALYSNPARDVQTALLTTKTTPLDFGKAFAKGFINIITGKKGDVELERLAREAGALQGSIFREGLKPEEIIDRLIEKDKHGVFFQTVRHPLQAVEALGQKAEEFTRMTVFKSALKNGATLDEAAKLTRNATVDFSRSGNTLQAINKLVPFLNARIQGMLNLGAALRRDPTQFYRRAMYTAVYPTSILFQNNSKYESYQQIPDNEKRKYWIIMTGEGMGKDVTGKSKLTPYYIKIPKGEAQQAISNVLERVMSKGKEKYPSTTAEFLTQLVGDFSPVTEANVLPPGLQQFIELKTNYSLFRDKQIVPEYIQVKKHKWMKADEVPAEKQILSSTSEVAKKLGEALGWSPIKIDYVIKTGVLNDFIRAIDLPIKGFKGKEGFQQATELPVLRSIIGSSNYGLDLKKKEAERKKIIEKNKKKLDRLKPL